MAEAIEAFVADLNASASRTAPSAPVAAPEVTRAIAPLPPRTELLPLPAEPAEDLGTPAKAPRPGKGRIDACLDSHLPKHLPREEVVIAPAETSCPCCGGDPHVIGEDVSERLDKIPAKLRVIVTRRPTLTKGSYGGREMWIRIPKDDAWKQVTLASVADLGQRIWLQCTHCSRNVIVDGLDFGREKGVDADTPLLLIARRLRCGKCGENAAHSWPEPYSIRRDEAE